MNDAPTRRGSVAIVTEQLPSSDRGEVTGGIEARCFYVGRHLEAIMDVQYVADRTDGTAWAPASLASIPRRVAFLVRTFAALLRSDAEIFDATNHVVYPLTWLAAKLKRRRVVFTFHDVFSRSPAVHHLGMAGRLLIWIEWLSVRLPVDRYIVNSRVTMDKLIDLGVPRDRIDRVPNGYEETISEPILASLRPTPRPPTMVVVSRLVSYKRVDVAVRALARLAPDVADVSLRVIGQGPERDRLEHLADALGVADRLHFDGFVASHMEVLRILGDARCLVSASEIEGFGIVVVEAQSVGTPAVLSDIPAFREVIDGGVGGALFASGDDAALADVLLPLLTNDSLWTSVSNDAIAHSAQYRWSEVARATADTYRSIVGPPRVAVAAGAHA